MAEFMLAMAHPARVAIMIKLAELNDCLVNEVVPNIPIPNKSVQRHLLALEYAGLIKGVTAENRSHYCIDWEIFGEFLRNFRQFFEDYAMRAAQLDCQAKKGRRKSALSLLWPILNLIPVGMACV